MVRFGRALIAALVSLVPLSAASAQSEISITLGETSIPDGATSVSFGSVTQGCILERVFTIHNTGTSNLVLTGLSLSNSNFTVTQLPSTPIAPGNSTTMKLRVNQSGGQGNYATAIVLNNNDLNENPYNIGIVATVTAPAPDIKVELEDSEIADGQAGVQFGSTAEGFPLVREFTITNTGSAILALGDATVPSGYTVTQQPNGNVSGCGGSTTLQVRLNANSSGTFNGTISIPTNDPDEGTFVFAVTGTVTEPQPEINVKRSTTNISDGGTFSFGPASTGCPISRVFTIENTGTAALTVGNVTVPAGFTVLSQPSSPISIDGSTTFEVQMDAGSAGQVQGQLTFNNNDPNENPYNFTISGQVSDPEPEIAVSENGANVPDGGTYAYGSTPQGAPITKTFTINNVHDCTADLVLGAIAVPTGYTITTAPTSPVPPNGSTTLEIRLDAAATGNYNGQVTIQNNDSNENPYNFQVTGTVTPPAPEIALFQDTTELFIGSTYGFGTTTRGFPIDKVFTIENNGSLDLTITNFKVPKGYSIITPPPATIAAGADADFEVRFLADKTGQVKGKIQFKTNDNNEKDFKFEVTSFANAPEPEIVVEQGGTNVADGSSFDFGSTIVGAPVTYTFDVSNTGTADLKLKKVKVPGGYKVTAQPTLTIPPSGGTSFTVELTATRRGNYNGRLSFSTNDTTEKPYDFLLSGVVDNALAAIAGRGADNALIRYANGPAALVVDGLTTIADLFNAGGVSSLWRVVYEGKDQPVANGELQVVGAKKDRDAVVQLLADGWSFDMSQDFSAKLDYRFVPTSVASGEAGIEMALVMRAADALGETQDGAVLELRHAEESTELSIATVGGGDATSILATDVEDRGSIYVWYIAQEDNLYISAIGADDEAPVVISNVRTRAGFASHVTLAIRGWSDKVERGDVVAAVDRVSMSGRPVEMISGDANLDGVVDGSDLNLVMNAVGRRGANRTADLNRDGSVTNEDLRIVISGMAR